MKSHEKLRTDFIYLYSVIILFSRFWSITETRYATYHGQLRQALVSWNSRSIVAFNRECDHTTAVSGVHTVPHAVCARARSFAAQRVRQRLVRDCVWYSVVLASCVYLCLWACDKWTSCRVAVRSVCRVASSSFSCVSVSSNRVTFFILAIHPASKRPCPRYVYLSSAPSQTVRATSYSRHKASVGRIFLRARRTRVVRESRAPRHKKPPKRTWKRLTWRRESN